MKWRCDSCGFAGYSTEFPYDYSDPDEDDFDDNVPYCPKCRSINIVEDTGNDIENNYQTDNYVW